MRFACSITCVFYDVQGPDGEKGEKGELGMKGDVGPKVSQYSQCVLAICGCKVVCVALIYT